MDNHDSDTRFATLVEVLRWRARRQPDRLAYTFLADGEAEQAGLDYAGLDHQARALAARLQGLQAQGERALLLYPAGLEFVVAFLGCLYAGVTAVPAYPPGNPRHLPRLQAIASDAEARLVLTTTALSPKIQSWMAENAAFRQLQSLATDALPDALAEHWRAPDLNGGQLAFLQYTSGSTATPKGVMVSHANLLGNSACIREGFGLSPESLSVSWLPHFHDMGLIDGIIQPLYTGFPAYLMAPNAFLQQPIRWLEALSRYRATHTSAPNFAYDLCVAKITPSQRQTLDLSAWSSAINGAEPVRAETLERFAETFGGCGFRATTLMPGYGLAEGTLFVSCSRCTEPWVTYPVAAEALAQHRIEPGGGGSAVRRLVSSGRVAGDVRVVIIDPATRERCPPDRIGEIWVAGSGVAQGYWRRLEATEESFRAHLADVPDAHDGPFLRTGDLGFLREDGELFVTGRLKDLLIVAGTNHYPQDIEVTVAESHPALRAGAAAAFALEENGEERLVVVCEVGRTQRRRLDGREIFAQASRTVAETHDLALDTLVLLKPGTLPKTSSGKIQRSACRAGYLSGGLITLEILSRQILAAPPQADEAAPRPPSLLAGEAAIRDWLVARIGRLLGLDSRQVNIHRPLAEYGLVSRDAVGLSGELESRLGRRLAPTLVYDHPTIAALAAYLSGARQPDAFPIRSLPATTEPIAVIGLGCRFPGAPDSQAFWRLLRDGVDAITRTTRWEAAVSWGGFIDGVDRFDAGFFGIAPREARQMDPQQRILLEVAWEALEHAGLAPERLAGSPSGVFVGISTGDYAHLQRASASNAYAGTGRAFSIAANRLSYVLDWHGPSWTVDTACSSSLVAVHQAAQSLRLGECDLALAGGVNLLLAPALTDIFSQAGMLAPDGRCKTFDARADGYGRGEGCGLVVLKRLSDARRDGDRVLALLRGSAVNQDGRSNGLTAPNGAAQRAVILQALRNSGVEAAAIGYVEAHGTGTVLGDPIELNTLKQLLAPGRTLEQHQPCCIGSVKTNIGHLEAAAGIAGLIKVILALQHGEIPAHLHLHALNPAIDLSDAPILIPTRPRPWGPGPRLAGVSSFGFGGTNAHLIVEEAPPPADVPSPSRPRHLLALSAKTPAALKELAQAYQDWLATYPEASLVDVCFTANTGRSHFAHRLTVGAESIHELRERLEALIGEWKGGHSPPYACVSEEGGPRIVFLFTGQGAQYPGMGRRLYETQPGFRRVLDHCGELLAPHLDRPLLDLLYGEATDRLNETAYTQPALFALEYALAMLWQSWGIAPAAVLGHSVGEYVAACLAGVFSLEEGLRLIAERGRLMQALPRDGGMAAVFAGEAPVTEQLLPYTGQVSIAALNGPDSVVISGRRPVLDRLLGEFARQGIETRPLAVSHAFHSPLLEPMLEAFREQARQVAYRPPRLPLISNLSGGIIDAAIATPDYWVAHARQPVRFATGMETLARQGYRVFLEVGPQPVLAGMGRQCLAAPENVWLPSLRQEQEDWRVLLDSLGELYALGVPVDWPGFDRDYLPRRKLALPTYPFQRSRYWLEESPAAEGLQLEKTEGEAAADRSIQNAIYEMHWQPLPELGDVRPPPAAIDDDGRTWLLLADAGGLAERLAARLGAEGQRSLRVYPGGAYRRLDSASFQVDPASPDDFQRLLAAMHADYPPLRGVVHLWSLDAPASATLTTEALAETSRRLCGSALYLFQTLLRSEPAVPALYLVTRGAQAVRGEAELAVASSSLWGLGKVMAMEHPELPLGLVDLDPATEPDEGAVLFKELLAPARPDEFCQARRGGQGFVPRLQPGRAARTRPLPIHADAGYLITGGLGGIGLQVARWLVERGARQLLLVGRSGAGETARSVVRELETLGARITVAQADVAEADQLAGVLREARPTMAPLRGVIHAAGVFADRLLVNHHWELFAEVFAPKVLGAWNLHRQTRSLELDFFVLFSSVAALLGTPGLANYVAANAFLDSLAHYRRGQGLPGLSIDWGPWAGVGMARAVGSRREGQWAVQGVTPLEPAQGLAALGQLLSQEAAQGGVFDIDWEKYLQSFPVPPAFLEAFRKAPQAGIPAEDWRQRLQAAPAGQRQALLKSSIRALVAGVLGFQSPEAVDEQGGFFQLGMDSLTAMELRRRLQAGVGQTLPATVIFTYPTVEKLADYLAREVLGLTEAQDAEDKAKTALATEVKALSAQEVEASIARELAELENLLGEG